MRSFLRIGSFCLLSSAGVAAGCSAASSSASEPDPALVGTTDPNGADGGGVVDPSKQTPAWSEAAVDPLFRVGRVAGDARGVWTSLYPAKSTGGQWTVKVAQIGADGTLAERYANTVDAVVSSNYGIAGLSPVTSTTAAIGGEWFFEIIGVSPKSLGGSGSYITAIYAHGENDVWAGSRVGTLQHYTGGSSVSSGTFVLADRPEVAGLWQSKSALYLATIMGIRSAALPLPSGWSGTTTRVIGGEFAAIAGSADDDAFAVGKGGLVAHFDGASWTAQASGTTGDLGAIAARAHDDAWASSSEALFHYDGTRWSTVNELGMPKGAGSVAIASDGTLWVAHDGKLLRRSPGPVAGTATPQAVAADGGACAFGEPNDTALTATELTPPFTVNACAASKDLDDYTFMPPAGKAGFISVTLTDTAGEHPTLSVDANVQNQPTAAYIDGVAGTSKSLFLPVPAAERRHIDVLQSRTGVATGAYTLDVNYTFFDDKYEPNDSYDAPYAITSGTAIHSYFPTGAMVQSSFGTSGYADYEDWYTAVRPAGPFTVSLTDVPADCRGRLSIEGLPGANVSGTQLGNVDGASLGAPVTFSGTLAVAGKVKVRVTDFAPRILDGAHAPGAFTQKYTLLIGN